MGRLKASYNWLTKTKLGFFTVVVVFFWIKTYLTYITKFNLGVVGSMQNFLLLINPLPTAILLIGIGLFFKGRKSYWIMVLFPFSGFISQISLAPGVSMFSNTPSFSPVSAS